MANRITATRGKYEWSWTRTYGPDNGLFIIKCNACKVELRRIDVQEDATSSLAQKLMADHICKPKKKGLWFRD